MYKTKQYLMVMMISVRMGIISYDNDVLCFPKDGKVGEGTGIG